MPTTADYLNQLIDDKADLVAILNAKGVTASDTETFTELVPKVDTIPSGGSGAYIIPVQHILTDIKVSEV